MIDLTGWDADGFKGNLSLVLSDGHGGILGLSIRYPAVR